MAASTFNHSEL